MFVDSNGLENAILNLAVNARDAMPESGGLTIATGNTIPPNEAADDGAGPIGACRRDRNS